MKKSKLTLGLVTSFIAATALAACGSKSSSSKEYLVTFNGYDGKSYNLVTDEVYAQYRHSNSGISQFKDQILEVMIRNEFSKSESEKSIETEKELGTIQTEAKNDVKSQKTTAKENAKTNGTSYKKEFQAILDSNGVEDEDELYQLFVYQKEKEQIEDGFYDKFEDVLRQEYLGVNADGTAVAPQAGYNGVITSKLPYHIRHILVKVEDGGSNYSTGTITKDQAKRLYDIVSALADGVQSFGQIALTSSDDGSKSKYGDVGIMTNNASAEGNLGMVKEFQLGLYAYDAIFNKANENKSEAVKEGLGISDALATKLASTNYAVGTDASGAIAGLTEVPYSVFEDLNTYQDTTKDETGHELANGNSAIYPRNILWNKYLNHHNIFVITNTARTAGTISADGKTISEDVNALDYANTIEVPSAVEGKPGFRTFKEAGLSDSETKKVLTDEQGRVIVGVRSEFGIHFMIIQKSIFDYDNEEVSLEEYYTTLTPNKDGYPKDSAGNAKLTYVNYINTKDQSELSSRADEVKSAIKSFDTTYEYRLFEYLLEQNKDSFTWKEDADGTTLKDNILDYIKLQRELNDYNQEKGIGLAWDTYFEMIEQQNYERVTNAQRIVPEGCVIGFKKGADFNKDAYEKGGACYYGK